MNSVYFDVNDILADDQVKHLNIMRFNNKFRLFFIQRIKVKFLCSVPWKGLSTSESEEIVQGKMGALLILIIA